MDMLMDGRFREWLREFLAKSDGVHEASKRIEFAVLFESGGEAEYTTGEHVRGVEDASEREVWRGRNGERASVPRAPRHMRRRCMRTSRHVASRADGHRVVVARGQESV